MEKKFAELVERHVPRANPDIMNGLACKHLENVEEYMDRVFDIASVNFPPGLVYEHYERCTPYEEFEELAKFKNNKRTYDLAPSTTYMVKYKFSFKGERLPDRYIILPYVEAAGTIRLSGSRFHLTPVLSDKVISSGKDNVFVRVLQTKLVFKRCYHFIMVDGVRETTHMIWSHIHKRSRKKDKVPPTTKALTCVAHYLFCKFGFDETFRRFTGTVPIVGGAEITPEHYPKEEWVICESAHGGNFQVSPKTYIQEFYKGTQIRLAIPRSHWTDLMKALVVGFYYVVDHFPTRIYPGDKYLNNVDQWKILLGHILYSGLYGEGRLHTFIEEHFDEVDSYLDDISVDKLKERGYQVNDFYELLVLILSEFNTMIMDSEHTGASMYGKNLEVLYYTLFSVTYGIISSRYGLSKLANKKDLTLKDIKGNFTNSIRAGNIFHISSNRLICEAVAYSGDHKYIKLTSKITEQEAVPGGTRGKGKYGTPGEGTAIEISMIEGGSVLYMSKRTSTPTGRVNPYIILDPDTSTILPNPKFKELREETNRLLITGKL